MTNGATMTTESSTADPSTGERPAGWAWKRALILAALVLFFAFWTWALFFASKEAVNRIDDRAWAERAESICAEATETRLALADYTRIDTGDASLIDQRADLVDEATDILEAMLDDVMAVAPTDAKGLAIVPEWEADYRTYLDDRREYADELRDSGENLAFYETGQNGLPVSERVAVFAGDNEMPSCAPPRDLAQ